MTTATQTPTTTLQVLRWTIKATRSVYDFMDMPYSGTLDTTTGTVSGWVRNDRLQPLQDFLDTRKDKWTDLKLVDSETHWNSKK